MKIRSEDMKKQGLSINNCNDIWNGEYIIKKWRYENEETKKWWKGGNEQTEDVRTSLVSASSETHPAFTPNSWTNKCIIRDASGVDT